MAHLDMESVKKIALERFKNIFDVTGLTDRERKVLTVGYEVQATTSIFTFYIPGQRPQDGRILAEIRLDRRSGAVVENESTGEA